nr:MAG TPA: hypothetical protein [Caudoviricetes sp.]
MVWFTVSALKTDVRKRTVVSNPTLTAKLKLNKTAKHITLTVLFPYLFF